MGEFPVGDTVADGDSFQIDARRYALLLRRWWPGMAGLMALSIVIAFFYTRSLPSLYVASATMMIDPHTPSVLGRHTDEVVALGPDFSGQADYYRAQLELLSSRMLIQQTVTLGGFDREPQLIGDAPPGSDRAQARAAAALAGSLRVQLPDENRVFTVAAWSGSAELAARIANQHVAAYVAYQRGLRSIGTGEAGRWLRKELDAAKASLRTSEEGIYGFRRTNDMLAMTLEERRTLILKDIERFTDALTSARVERLELDKTRQRLDAATTENIATSAIFDLLPNETTRDLKQAYHMAVTELAELEIQFGPKHTDYLQHLARIASLERALSQEASLTRTAIEQRFLGALDRERSFAAEIARLRQEAFVLGPKEQEYRDMVRKQEADEAQLARLTDRLRSSELESRLDAVNVQPLDAALPPGAAALPRLTDNLVKAIGAAFVLSLSLLVAIGFLDRRIRTVEQLEGSGLATVLGVLPTAGRQLPDGPDLVWATLRDSPQSRLSEAARGMRTNVLFASAGAEIRALAVTSAVHFEGKTSTVLAIGMTLAESGKRVLLVDTDMRRPRLAAAIRTSQKPGLAELMLGDVTLAEAIKATDRTGLDILPCGALPPNPCELLMSQRFGNLLTELKSRYDLVVFDTPPALAVTDAMVVGRQVDGVIIVARAGRSLVPQLRRVEQQLRAVDARLLGTVLNDLDLKTAAYYGYSYYGVAPQTSSDPVGDNG